MGKRKILHVVGSLSTGGAENVAVNYIRYADPARYQMDYLVYDNDQSGYTREVETLGGNVMRLRRKPGFLMGKSIYSFLLDNQYDVVHAHMMLHNGIVLKAAKRAGVPLLISHSHSTAPGRRKTVFLMVYERLMRRSILTNADKLLSCGRAAGEYLYGKEAFQERGHVLQNRIDLGRFRNSEARREKLRTDFGWEKNEMIAIFAGRFDYPKNPEFAIRVAEKCTKRNANFRLEVLGDGKQRENLEHMVRDLKLEGIVRFHGMVSNVSDYMAAADILLMPSYYEGFPVVAVEAQASGLPCVISDKITEDAAVTDLVRQLPIKEDSLDLWAEEALTVKKVRYDANQMLREAGFDIKEMSEDIEFAYS